MNVLAAIGIKLVSVLMFAVMSMLIRYAGQKFPLGQIVFFRSAFAIFPVLLVYGLRGELHLAVRTARPFGHLGRGISGIGSMFLNFAALARLPLMDATAISFASPLMTVVLAAVVLRERVRVYRWSAVVVGFTGVIVMLWPYLDLAGTFLAGSVARSVGVVCAVIACFTNAANVIQTRRLTDSETTASIVFYFSLICAIAGLATVPLGWLMPSPTEFAMLVAIGLIGGFSHILLTESYRYAPTSVVAPFDYTGIIWAFLLGYLVFAELPTAYVFIGALIVAASGIAIILREHKLGVERPRGSMIEGEPVGE